MPTAVSTQKPSTRASSRYTLNLASVGKALADVINKDMSTSEKSSKKSKEDKEAKDDAKASKTHGRRSSTVPETDTTRRRQSLNPKPLAKDVTSPPATITTRTSRRLSAQPDVSAVTEDGIMLERAATISPGTARRASLRPRTNATSGLPKYRPRSMLVEPNKKQQLSPQKTRRQPSSSDAESELTGDQDLTKKRAVATRLNLRRRASDSDDESEEKRDDLKPAGLEERSKRSVSPLPIRARQPHVQVTVSPSTPVSKVKIPARKGSESPNRAVTPADQRSASPARASPAASAKAKTSSIPRPPSSGSVSSSSSAQQPTTPRTPQTPTPVRKAKKSASPGNTGSPLRHAVPRREGSPLGKFSGKSKKSQLSPVQGSPAGAEFVEGNSMDSAADVEFMLSAIASPTAPTPAIPRFRTQAFHPGLPETPLRLPARGDLSYLSPLPPGSGHSPRPLRPNHPANDRGSILSWDQLAAIGERSLGEGETRKMLADIPAPFSASSSPALSAIDLPHTPESPAMTLPSPAGYGSISQVLLPDVTPSPAPVRMQFSASSSSADQEQTSALVTMLRLQLAAQERLASERLYQMQALEAQLGTAKDARMRDAHELAGQIGTLEEQMRATLDARDRAAEEHSTRVNALEQQLAAEAGKRERAVQAAAARAAEDTARAQAASAERQGRRWMATCAAKQAGTLWEAVGDSARAETDMIEASRQTLAVLLSGLDRCQAQLFAA